MPPLPSGQQPAPAGRKQPPGRPVPPPCREGQTLYNQLCQTCHGPAGQGGGDRGPALTTGTFTHGSGDADLFRAIRVRRARDPDGAICRIERHADLAARRLSPQPSGRRADRGRRERDVRPAPSGVEGRCRRRRSAVLRPCRVRELSRSERPRRDRRAGPVERRTTVACGAAAEDRQSERARAAAAAGAAAAAAAPRRRR